MSVLDILRQRLGIEPADIAGASAAGEIPIRQSLVNRLLAERLRDHPHVASVRVEPLSGDAMAVLVVPRMRLMPPMRLHVRIEGQPEFPDHPVLILRWGMPAAGPLAMFAAPVLSYFKALPPGIAVDGDRIRVDVGRLLRDRGLGELLAFIRRAALHTRPDGFVVTYDITIQ